MAGRKVRHIIGLTGQTGSGKSTIAAALRERGAHVLDADKIARALQQSGQDGYEAIKRYFGADYVTDTAIDRKKLAALVFADKQKLAELNGIMFPLITREVEQRLQELCGVCIIDAALLCEAGIHTLCDEVWVATAQDDIRLKRIMQRDGLTREAALARMASQKPPVWPGAVMLDTSNGLDDILPVLDKTMGTWGEVE